MKSSLKYVVMFLITPVFLICLVGLIEGVNFIIRDIDRIKMFDEELGWSHYPDKVTVIKKVTYTINSKGFRSAEIDPEKEKVLIVGDSIAFGQGIEDNETAAYYLGKELNRLRILLSNMIYLKLLRIID